MAGLSRYITIQAVKTKKNELIPFWDKRVKFVDSEHYGKYLELDNGYDKYDSLVDCIYDMKTGEINAGVELNCYKTIEELKFKIGESVLLEKSHRELYETKIVDIVFEKYDLSIKKGSKFHNYEKGMFKDIAIEKDTIYSIKTWEPTYILEDGKRVDFELNLYRKV